MKTGSGSTSITAIAVGTIVQLADGSIQSCNQEATIILGYSAKEMSAVLPLETPWQVIHEESSPFAPNTHPAIAFGSSRSVVAALETSQSCCDVEIGFHRPDGSLVWLLLDSQPLFSGDGDRPSAVVTNFRDITAAKNLERTDLSKLQVNSNLKTFADAVPGVLYLFDAISQRNTYVNSQAYDLLGYTPEEILAMGNEFISQVMHPEDLAHLPAHFERLERSQPGEIVKLEYRMRHKNGEWRWFCTQERVYSRTADGKVEQILGIARDITARKLAQSNLKESEERLNLATVASNIGMWFWDLVEDKLEFTPQCKALFGIPLDREVSLEQFFNILHPDDRDRTQQAIDLALANKTEYNTEYRAVWSDGSIHWLKAKGRCFYNRDDEPIRMIGTVQNITSLKQSAQQLKENESLLRLAIANAKAGTWDLDLTTQEIVWSPENYELYGIDPTIVPLRYQDWEHILHPDDLEKSSQEVQKVISKESSEFRAEFRVIHPQKGIRWLLGIGNVICNEDGVPVRLSGLNLDITDSKESEAALNASKKRLRELIDSLVIYVGVLTPDGVLIDVNSTALKAANLKAEEVLNKPFAETYWWSFDPEIQNQLNEAIKRAAAGETVRYDTIARMGEDKFIYNDFSIVPIFNEAGQVEYLIANGMDISDREQSNQALQQREYELELITEVIPQQVWTATSNGRINYINQRAKDYTGLSLEQILRQDWLAVVHPDDLRDIYDKWVQAIKSEQKFDAEARLRGVDGKYRWFLVKARPLRDRQGEITKWYGTNTSITRIKELEKTLIQQTEDLTNANQLKDEFLAIVSHELRTPLNPILGWSQLLAQGRLNDDKIAQGIEIIERNAKLQAQLIDDLLDVSRILQDKLNLNKCLLNLESVIRAAIATVQLMAEAKSIQIETEFEPNIGQVSGDPDRLQQIVWNLVSNAIKFTPEQGRILVKLKQIEQHAVIQVQDTGQGIEPEFLPYVFDRFRQAQSSSTREFGGLGLGLAIVRHLSELHDGSVEVNSPGKGQGATFNVKLPIVKTTSNQINNQLGDLSVQPSRFKGSKILVIDDEVDSLDILTLVLEQEGAEVISVASAAAALETLARLTPDLIVSDIGMPIMDGHMMMSQIRNLPQGEEIPAIALTAYAGEIDKQKTFDAGFKKHISKPIDIPELLSAISELI